MEICLKFWCGWEGKVPMEEQGKLFFIFSFFRFPVPVPRAEFHPSDCAHCHPENQKWHDCVEPGGGGWERDALRKCEFEITFWSSSFSLLKSRIFFFFNCFMWNICLGILKFFRVGWAKILLKSYRRLTKYLIVVLSQQLFSHLFQLQSNGFYGISLFFYFPFI